MNKLINPKIQEEKMIDIEESSNEEDTRSKKIEGTISQALESIEENIRSIPDVPVKKLVDKGKEIILELSIGTSRKHLGLEEDMECMQVQDPVCLVEEQAVSLAEVPVG